MKLKCYVNGKEYDLVQGVTFVDEYNETLDSGSIIVDQVEKIEDLQPYDDVFIYSDDKEFKGYNNSNTEIKGFWNKTLYQEYKIRFLYDEMKALFQDSNIIEQDVEFIGSRINAPTIDTWTKVKATFVWQDNRIAMTLSQLGYTYSIAREGTTNYMSFSYRGTFNVAYFGFTHIKVQKENVEMPSFYKHLLVYQYSEERLNPVKNIYKYTIELCSETKKLETIQLPNISITQPLNIEYKRSVWDYINQYLNLYNPKIKMAINNYSWLYQEKYTLDESLASIYSDVYCPDFSLDNPSLRDVFNQLFLVKDRIPYVKDDKIYAMDITERKNTFSTNNITSIKGSRSYENHADNLKRTYTQALSGRNTARRVEFLGFRNSNNALMTIENMRLETQFPIYKINRILMCYYKKAHIYKDVTEGEGDEAVPTPTYVKDMVFLCKQDITSLVKLEQERQVLSQDWNDFEDDPPEGSNCVEEMAQYKLCTIGYSIGGKTIEGWGTKYTYPKGWWDITKTYIENIFLVIDKNLDYGIYTYGFITQHLGKGEYIYVDDNENPLDNIITPFSGSSRLKSFFFEVDYEAFYEGTVITSKDVDRDDITINDNSSSSLTLLEKDGLFQKEKANRFGNMAYTIEAIYDSLDEMQDLGSVYDDDIIIYHREFSIFHNYIKVLYYGTKDYVLKNYFTSVYAKHRPFALLDYGQSVVRAENKKTYVMLSTKELYYEDRLETIQNIPLSFENFEEINGSFSYLDDVISFLTPNPKVKSIDRYIFDKKINFGYFEHNGNQYSCDMNTFTNGYSLCFNLSMNDNISAGNYIKVAEPDINTTILQPTDDDYTGSIQDFYPVVDNMETGFTQYMQFWATHISEEENFDDIVFEYNPESSIADDLYERLFNLPKLENGFVKQNKIGGDYKICKDNKEVINMTFQIEVYTNDENIFFSEWLLKLSDLNGIYNKVEEDYTITDVSGYQQEFDVYYGTGANIGADSVNYYIPVIILKIPVSMFDDFENNNIYSQHSWSSSRWPGTPEYWLSWSEVGYQITMQKIASVEANKIGIFCSIRRKNRKGLIGSYENQYFTTTLYFTKFTSLGDLDVSSDTNNYYFTNIEVLTGILRMEVVRTDSNTDIGWFSDGNTYNQYKTTLKESGLMQDSVKVSDLSEESKTYYKNLFVVEGKEKIKKNLIYDELRTIIPSSMKISDVLTEIIEDNSSIIAHDFVNKLRLNLVPFRYSPDTKSIQIWFYDEKSNSFVFVFGVNITEEDISRGYIDIYMSSLSKKDKRIYNTNHLVCGKILNFVSEDNEEKYGERQYYVLE